MDKELKLIEMTLEGVRIELPTQKPILLLKEINGNRYLPIWVGAPDFRTFFKKNQEFKHKIKSF